ncbi:glycoside hydrolase family 35 protein [Microbacterium imperiale]|uniref:Beta-galactosidase n=1 Tax=Microbacterium imperiale TaxID=33884 RepID=A0A9W6HHR9_9MICO|nr:beta-galactosidase family protein [Microbacterium imperiale]MBP2421460.1 beta-galactosidase [Microbacterium imperiale]MDS0199433.1 beta-galactosidase [Microbacterium imperiale]BFE41799.1 beta-galactosidase [Microbacterium imperiale]GLJ80751.1 beta-galactosidase [Microbacterium imperiale]
MTTFAIGDTDFLLDGRPHRVIAGALHYFRIHPDHWADRIRKARLMGLNTIETYVAWNAHEPVRGEWDATGWNDLGRFLDLIAAEGMHAIVRPGPYICAEWHNGGLPVWLTSTPGIGLRRSEPQYVEAVSTYLRRVYEIVAPRQIDRGGNVVLVQIENEYGAYGSDHDYLRTLTDLTRACDITVPLTTVDQPEPHMLTAGTLPDLHTTGSFGSRATERLATLREHQPTGPLMCSEFWDGWFDWWGGVHHTTDAAASAAELDALLAAGASVNIYMLHGGSNFGTTNGANDKGRYAPIVTSYDYDAPLDESGHPTEKFHAFREVIARYAPVPDEVPPARPAAPVLSVPLRATGDWLPASTEPAGGAATPPAFEDLGQLGPLVRYDIPLPAGAFGEAGTAVLSFTEVRDLAWIAVDSAPIGRLQRALHERSLPIPRGAHLTVLVEDQGRVNYDVRLGENKGLVGTVTLGGRELTGWSAQPVDLAAVAAGIPAASEQTTAGRTGLAGTFDLDEPADLFLDTEAWSKGYAFVNGFFLGRYWRNGPQRTLYVPAPATRAGANEIVVVELEHVIEPVAAFVAAPDLGHREE